MQDRHSDWTTAASALMLAGRLVLVFRNVRQCRRRYVISVRVDRDGWQEVSFAHLSEIDPEEALGRFEIARSLDRSANFRAIQPLNSRSSPTDAMR